MTSDLPALLGELPVSNEEILSAAIRLMKAPQNEMPLTHRFAPGIYMREIFMPKDTLVIGHEHRTRHFNVVLKGRASVLIEGKVHEIVAPCTFVSNPGVMKVLLIHEDMIWQTLHANPTDETDTDKLEESLIIIRQPLMEAMEAMKTLSAPQPLELVEASP